MRDKRFTFVYSTQEQQMLKILASKKQRTRSDTVRLLIRAAYGEEILDEDSIQEIRLASMSS